MTASGPREAAGKRAGARQSGAPIQRRKLYQEVLERLLARIRAGEFAGGGQLPSERQLMEEYSVGRPAVREALLTLQRMGLIAITHGDRARLNEISADTAIGQVSEIARYLLETTPDSLEHLKEARLFFEVGMACMAAEKATDRDIARLRAALEAHRIAREDPDFLERDIDFHRAIAAVSGNPIFEAVSAAMLEWLQRFYVGMLRVQGAERVTIQEHKRIVDCIAGHDPEGAAKAMTHHLTRAAKLYTRLGLVDGVPPER
jgi:DNA-binding FadR family transcriptional regulator